METDYLPNLASRLENAAFCCEMALREALNMTDNQDASDVYTVGAMVRVMEKAKNIDANWELFSGIFSAGELCRDAAYRLQNPGQPRGFDHPNTAALVGAANHVILPPRC